MATQDSAALLAQLKAAKRLPSPPGTALRVLELCRSDQTEAGQIAEAIMCDPALAGRILKFANSAMVGVSREVTTVRDAVLFMGVRTVKMAALGFALATPDAEQPCAGFSLKRFWQESSATAVTARRLADAFFASDKEEGFTVGLLAGLGRLGLAQGLREKYGRMIAMATSHKRLAEVERTVLRVDHAHFGAQMLSEWGLPALLVEAVRHQYQPECATGRAAGLARLLHTSVRLAPLVCAGEHARPEAAALAQHEIEATLGLDPPTWSRLADQISDDHRQVAAVFNIRLDGQAAMADLYAAAQEESARVGIVAQVEGAIAIRAAETLLKRATTDTLTGVGNRWALDEWLAGLISNEGGFALLMLDIDHFKKVNDTHGHQTGDMILRRVADALRGALAAGQKVFRYGGEEFAVVVDGSGGLDGTAAGELAERLRRCVEELQVEVGDKRLGVTISIGVTTTADYPPGMAPERMIAEADRELYRSKTGGRNTWSYAGRDRARRLAGEGGMSPWRRVQGSISPKQLRAFPRPCP
jgi:diguanylate cyclase (GGDEF)-like protein